MNNNSMNESENPLSDSTRAGLVAVVGRPNVGKSTLVNAIVGEKVSIVTPKPQTTRHRIIGVYTQGSLQVGFVDTPGLHAHSGKALNKVLNQTAAASLAGVDAVVLVVEAGQWRDADEQVLERVKRGNTPVILVANKVDRLPNPSAALPFIQDCAERHDFAFILPCSAKTRDNLKPLISELENRIPPGPFLFPEDEYTDRNLQFLVTETIREKLMMILQQELPYSVTVAIEAFSEDEKRFNIHAVIWVARDNHKAMVIGRGGSLLKKVGTSARQDLIRRLDKAVDLRLWVKVRDGWNENEVAVRDLGH